MWAMINATLYGSDKGTLENADIRMLTKRSYTAVV
jgi:hypothetical protein